MSAHGYRDNIFDVVNYTGLQKKNFVSCLCFLTELGPFYTTESNHFSQSGQVFMLI